MNARRLLFLLALSALWIHAPAAVPASQTYTVTDSNSPPDTVVFSGRDDFTIETATGKLVATGTYQKYGNAGLILTIPGYTAPTMGDPRGDMDTIPPVYLTDLLAEPGCVVCSNGSAILVSSDFDPTAGTPLTDTVTVYGNKIIITPTDGTDLVDLIDSSGGGTVVLGGTENNNSTGGTPSGGNPPGGGGGSNPAVVPEPSTWAMLLVSFAGLLILQRRRFGRR